MTTAKARILLSAEDRATGVIAGLKRELMSVQGASLGLKSALSGLAPSFAAALSIGGLTAFIRSAVNGLDALNDLKDATGSSIENLSALEDTAIRTGTSMETVGTAVIRLNKTLADAKPGNEISASLKAIGLSANELRELDPAQALLKVSVALAGFADDGEKARLVQLLFGKSIREVAPLLNDLAEKGELNATVTTEQALAAERFNQQMAALSKNVTDASRAITSELLPALNSYLSAVSRLPQNVGILAAGTEAMFDSETLKLAVSRVERLQEALSRNPGNDRLAAQLAEARKEADKLLASAFKTAGALRGMLPAPAASAGGGRGFVNPDRVRPSVTNLPPGTVPRGARAREDRPGPGYGPMGPFPLEEVNTPLSEAARDALRAIEATDIVKIQKINETLDQLFLLRATGGGMEVDEAIDALTTQLNELGPAAQAAAAEVQPAMAEISEFAQEAARNIQDALGDTLQASLAGNFDSIESLWKNMLTRMVAEAAAAQLNNYLFGAKGVGSGGGALGGLGDIFDFLTKGFSVAPRAAGGPITAGRAYLVGEKGPEIVVPRAAGTVLPNGVAASGATYVVNVQGDASENTLRLIRGAMAQFEARQMMRSA